MDFCYREVTLPPPFNLLSLLSDAIKYLTYHRECCKWYNQEDEVDQTSIKRKAKYSKLVKVLITKYLNNEDDTAEKVDVNNLENLSREVRQVCHDNNEEINEKLEKILLNLANNTR